MVIVKSRNIDPSLKSWHQSTPVFYDFVAPPKKKKNETLPRVHRRQLLSVSLCFGFLFVTPPTHPPIPPHPPPTYPPPPPTHLPPPTHPPLRFTREQTRVEYIRRCRLKKKILSHESWSTLVPWGQ